MEALVGVPYPGQHVSYRVHHSSPARLLYSGNLPSMGQLAEAEATDSKISQMTVAAATDAATVVPAHFELRLPPCLDD